MAVKGERKRREGGREGGTRGRNCHRPQKYTGRMKSIMYQNKTLFSLYLDILKFLLLLKKHFFKVCVCENKHIRSTLWTAGKKNTVRGFGAANKEVPPIIRPPPPPLPLAKSCLSPALPTPEVLPPLMEAVTPGKKKRKRKE